MTSAWSPQISLKALEAGRIRCLCSRTETTYSMKVLMSSRTDSPIPFIKREIYERHKQPARLSAAYQFGNQKINITTSFKSGSSLTFNCSLISVILHRTDSISAQDLMFSGSCQASVVASLSLQRKNVKIVTPPQARAILLFNLPKSSLILIRSSKVSDISFQQLNSWKISSSAICQIMILLRSYQRTGSRD